MPLRLTMAISDYAHTRDLVTGRVRPEGIDLNILTYPFEQVGLRFAMGKEFDVSEYSFAGYCAHIDGCARPEMVAIPVFPSRVFRQSAFYVNSDAGIAHVGDLRGKRVGIAQWSQTAAVYAKGYLVHQANVPLHEIDWVQAGVNRPGRKEGLKLSLPKGVRLHTAADRSLSDMIATGDIDAVISARPPDSFLAGHPKVRRLFTDVQAAEKSYFDETGIFPIMHVMVVRKELYDANRWILRNIVDAFDEAKRRTVNALTDITTSYFPVAWGADYMIAMSDLLFPDGNVWPYGVEANRKTLNAFLRYCHEQGVTTRLLTPEDLFPPECAYQVIV
ncbi:hypothetical protein [uncultured Roseibium sp.]|uniref:hypothetical protein n=1 Tax=uncultured Roseibium sp. TaxID=1936171 RepID=UPI00321642F9